VVSAAPVPSGVLVWFSDVTRSRRSQDDAEQRAEETSELIELTAVVTEQLAQSLDVDRTVEQLARLVVPRLADYAIVSLVDDDGTVRDVSSWHAREDARAVLAEFVAVRLSAVGDRSAVHQALVTAAPVVVESGLSAYLLQRLDSPQAATALAALAPESSAVLPLLLGSRVVGLLTLSRGAPRPPLSPQELTVALSITRRAAMALANAVLYRAQLDTAARLEAANRRLRVTAAHDRTVAQALQAAMLTELPRIERLHLTARYLTASGSDQVGGDWYDAVVRDPRTTVLVIGDVAGHDIGAAAVMGQLRNLLRAFTWDRREAPSRAVGRLDRAAEDLGLATLASLVVVHVEEAPDGSGHQLLWSSAGHPAPALLLPDGTAQLLDERTDLVLGVAPLSERTDLLRAVPAGTTLVLYTDGLVETRTAGVAEGQQRLLAALARHAGADLDALLDAVIADLVGEHPDDDVAVLAVRLG
jgi:serine phosphatase RsbU (regulator of sigma subunit)